MYEEFCRNTQIRDCGAEPFIVDIDRITKSNQTYRTALWTGNKLQVTVMFIPVGGDIGLEIHPKTEQFIRIEQGCALAVMGKEKDCLKIRQKIDSNYAVVVPAGTWHNIINTGNVPLNLYSIYAPPQHPFGTVHKTKKEAAFEEKMTE